MRPTASTHQNRRTACIVIALAVLLIATPATCAAAHNDGGQKTRTASPIKKVIVLCMENHSFDNMLGWMDAPIGDLRGDEYNLGDPANSTSQKYYVRRGAAWQTLPDPPHLFANVNAALYGTGDYPTGDAPQANMSGFAWQYGRIGGNPQNVMDCYTEDQVPIVSTLAREFKVMTRWFSSVPGPTDINKFFFHGATAGGNTQNCLSWYCYGYPIEMMTIYDSLLEDGHSWEIHWMDWCEAMAIEPLSTAYASRFVHDQDFTQFFDELRNGTLPDYTFLVPRLYRDGPDMYANSQHPFEDVRHGEALMKSVYEAVRASQYWDEALLLIVWDEHGGFWDSVPPPGGVVNPTPQDETGRQKFDWTRLGVRVPAIAISPWLAKGVVDAQQYEHASVPATVKAIFDLSAPYLTPRDANANHFVQEWEYLPQPRRDAPLVLPDVPTEDPFAEDDEPYEAYAAQEVRSSTRGQVHTLGSLLVKRGVLSLAAYEALLARVVSEDDGIQFCAEAARALGFRVRNARRLAAARFLPEALASVEVV